MANGSQSASSRVTARPATFQRTAAPQRGVLFGQLLRAGPARSGPIFDRLDAAGVAHIVPLLSLDEQALLARLVLGPERVARAATFDSDTLVRLMRVATNADAMRLYATLLPERSSEVRGLLCERMGRAATPAPERNARGRTTPASGVSTLPGNRISIEAPSERYSYNTPGHADDPRFRYSMGQRSSLDAAFSKRSSRILRVSSWSTMSRAARRTLERKLGNTMSS